MEFHTWSLKLSLTTPFHFGGDASLQSEIDAPLYRDEHGRIAVPGPHIAGRFRHFLIAVAEREEEAGLADEYRLARRSDIRRWFGIPGEQFRNPEAEEISDHDELDEEARSWERRGNRGRLTFRDVPLWVPPEERPGTDWEAERAEVERTRIRLGEETQAADRGSWQILEQWERSGAKAIFKAWETDHPTIELFAGEEERQRFEAAFEQFKQSLVALGGNKGQGFGRVCAEPAAVELCDHDCRSVAVPATTTNAEDCFLMRLRISHPFLVEPELRSGNLFRSSDVISGAVIKAAIAEYLALADPTDAIQLSEALSTMTFGHFRPKSSDRTKKTRFVSDDIVDVTTPGRESFASLWKIDPESQDFVHHSETKRRDVLKEEYPVHKPELVNRTRTAVELGAFTAAEGQLFNYQCVSPLRSTWVGGVVLPGKASGLREAAGQLCDFLALGIVQIGKTRSRIVDVERQNLTVPVSFETAKAFKIVLLSPAHLIGKDVLENHSGGKDIGSEYACVFERELGAQSNEIDWENFRIAVRHQWSGGIKSVRYKQAIRGEPSYFPHLLTQPGAAFLLPLLPTANGPSEKLVEILGKLRIHGLESLDSKLGWKGTPYLRENGYGELEIFPCDPPAA